MSYEASIIEALSLSAPVDPPAAVAAKWSALQNSLTNWRAMHAVSHQSMGGGPSVSMFEDKLAQMVAIDLRVYKNALAAAGLAADAAQQRRPSRKFTAESYQEMMEVNALTMGDGLTVFRWDKDGWPAVRFYDALSVDNPSNTYNTPEWIDGVRDGSAPPPAGPFTRPQFQLGGAG